MHIDDIILVAEEKDHCKFIEHFSKIFKFKADGPRDFVLPQEETCHFDAGGLENAESSKYVPKLVSICSRQAGTWFDATSDEERLSPGERSALALCLYLSQERIDIQHSVRILLTYMASPTKTAVAAIKKLYRTWIPTNENPADLNTKALTRERREQRAYGKTHWIAQRELPSNQHSWSPPNCADAHGCRSAAPLFRACGAYGKSELHWPDIG